MVVSTRTRRLVLGGALLVTVVASVWPRAQENVEPEVVAPVTQRDVSSRRDQALPAPTAPPTLATRVERQTAPRRRPRHIRSENLGAAAPARSCAETNAASTHGAAVPVCRNGQHRRCEWRAGGVHEPAAEFRRARRRSIRTDLPRRIGRGPDGHSHVSATRFDPTRAHGGVELKVPVLPMLILPLRGLRAPLTGESE